MVTPLHSGGTTIVDKNILTGTKLLDISEFTRTRKEN